MYYITSYKSINRTQTAPTTTPSSFEELKQLLNAVNEPIVITSTREKVTYAGAKPTVSQELKDSMNGLCNMLFAYNAQFQENKASYFSIFQIPKATGGFRTIKAPTGELKEAYTNVKKYLEDTLHVLPNNQAWAYVKERSVQQALEVHQKNESNFFLKLDLEGFFDNCSELTIIKQLSKVYPFHDDLQLVAELAKFAVLDNGLPQGTPLSPFLTNLIMVPFDFHLFVYCEHSGYKYTRYADDLLISSKLPFRFTPLIANIEDLFAQLEYPFTIKARKTRYGSRNGRNWNLGLMLNKDNQITVGHDFKHQMKVILYKLKSGELPTKDPHYMGLFAYLKQIEPTYYAQLNSWCYRKYEQSINALLTAE